MDELQFGVFYSITDNQHESEGVGIVKPSITNPGSSQPAVSYQDITGKLFKQLRKKSAIRYEVEKQKDVDKHDETTLGTMYVTMESTTATEEEQTATEEEQQATEEEQQAMEEEEQQAMEEEEEEQQASEEDQQAAEDEQTDEMELYDVSTEEDFPTNYSHVQIDLAMDTKSADEEKQHQSVTTYYDGSFLNDDVFTTGSHSETTTMVTDIPFKKTPATERIADHSAKIGYVDTRPHHVITSASRVHTMFVDILQKTEEIDFHCPLPFGFFADPHDNCSVYYACYAGVAEKRVCPEEMHFNPVSKLCDYRDQALCEVKCPEMNGRFHVPGYCNKFLECYLGQGKVVKCPADLHYNAITKQCDAQNKAACEITCPPDHDMLVSLPGRCEMYASCLEGNVTYHLCPYGLHFNPVLLRCDWPQSAGCEIECPYPDGYFPVLRQCGSFIVCHNNHAKVESCPSHLHFNFLLHTCDLPSKAGCNMECEKPNGFFPVPGVCSFYLMCLGGTPFLKRCPKDLEFNAATGQCAIVPKDHCLPHCPEDSGTFPVDDHCDLYVRCASGQALVKRCPGDLHFNALFKQCDTPQRAKCELKCPYPSGVFPIPGKCDKFYQCINNTAFLHSCSEGLHFNSRTKTCDWPASAKCEVSCPNQEGYAPVQGDCNAYVSCSFGRPSLKKCPFGKHFNFRAKRCDAPKKANCVPKCQADYNIFPLPGHCDSYLLCEDGLPRVNSCPPGLLFNYDTGMCDMPEKVKCHIWT